MTTIEIFEPRYRDRVVLLAKYRLPANADVQVNITKGSYKGLYLVAAADIAKAKDEVMMSKNGREIAMKAVPLGSLQRLEEKG